MFGDKTLPVLARKSSRSPLNPVEFQHTLSAGSRGQVCCHHNSKGVPLTRKKSSEEKRNEKLGKRSPGDIPINTSIKQKGRNMKHKKSCKHHTVGLIMTFSRSKI